MDGKIRDAICDKSCSQAMENIFKDNWVSNIPRYILTRRDYGSFLQNGFDWALSPQGYDYWAVIRADYD